MYWTSFFTDEPAAIGLAEIVDSVQGGELQVVFFAAIGEVRKRVFAIGVGFVIPYFARPIPCMVLRSGWFEVL